MATSILILNQRGKTLIQRAYRGSLLASSAVDVFVRRVIQNVDDVEEIPPIFQAGAYNYFYIRQKDIYFVAVSVSNVNALLIMKFLDVLIGVLKEYFLSVEEESIKDNFVLIYELLDEMMDNGYPQYTETKILKQYINQAEAHQIAPATIPEAVTGVTSHRPQGIVHKKNEVFLDVIEKGNVIMEADGKVIQSDVSGSIMMRSALSGMPELKLGLNDKVLLNKIREAKGRSGRKHGPRSVEMDDVRFHPCVRMGRFESNRTISFIPPDGEFQFMEYRVDSTVPPLFHIKCQIEEFPGSRIEYLIKIRSRFRKKSTANKVTVTVPVPEDGDTPSCKASGGKVKYSPEENALKWTFGNFSGQKQYIMRGHIGMPSIKAERDNTMSKAIDVAFEMPYFTLSGIKVRYLKITEKSGYKALPWVRYITRNGHYQVRMNKGWNIKRGGNRAGLSDQKVDISSL